MSEAGHMHHDMGGRHAGPVDRAAHSDPDWEKRVDALMMLLSNNKRRVIGVDELRRGVEQLGAESYSKLTYYERWVASITHNLLEKGIISSDELGRKMAAVEAAAQSGAAPIGETE